MIASSLTITVRPSNLEERECTFTSPHTVEVEEFLRATATVGDLVTLSLHFHNHSEILDFFRNRRECRDTRVGSL